MLVWTECAPTDSLPQSQCYSQHDLSVSFQLITTMTSSTKLLKTKTLKFFPNTSCSFCIFNFASAASPIWNNYSFYPSKSVSPNCHSNTNPLRAKWNHTHFITFFFHFLAQICHFALYSFTMPLFFTWHCTTVPNILR